MKRAIWMFLVIPAFAGAEIYQWKDEKGQVHFSDVRPASHAEVIKPAVSSVYEAPESKSSRRSSQADYQRQYEQEERQMRRQREEMRNQEMARVEEDRARQCRKARDDSRTSYTRSSSSPTDLKKLRQVRSRMDEVNDRIKRYCY